MIETVINLRDHEVWPKRKLRFDDAVAQTRVVLDALEARGLLRRPASAEEREALVNEAAMTVAEPGRRDAPRPGGAASSAEFRPGTGPRPGRRGGRRAARPRRARRPSPASRPPAEREALIEPLGEDLRRPARRPGPPRRRDAGWSTTPRRRLVDLGVLRDRPDLLAPPPARLERAAEAAGDVLGFARPTLFTRIAEHLDADHARRLKERVKSLNWELFDRAVGAAELGGPRRADEARPRPQAGRAGRRRRASCRPSAPRWTSRSPTGSCSGRRRRPTWSRR